MDKSTHTQGASSTSAMERAPSTSSSVHNSARGKRQKSKSLSQGHRRARSTSKAATQALHATHVLRDLTTGRAFPILEGSTLIGRSAVPVPETNRFVNLESPRGAISRTHAMLTLCPNGDAWIEDKGSTNGTWLSHTYNPTQSYVQGLRIVPGRLYQVTTQTRVTIGDVDVMLQEHHHVHVLSVVAGPDQTQLISGAPTALEAELGQVQQHRSSAQFAVSGSVQRTPLGKEDDRSEDYPRPASMGASGSNSNIKALNSPIGASETSAFDEKRSQQHLDAARTAASTINDGASSPQYQESDKERQHSVSEFHHLRGMSTGSEDAAQIPSRRKSLSTVTPLSSGMRGHSTEDENQTPREIYTTKGNMVDVVLKSIRDARHNMFPQEVLGTSTGIGATASSTFSEVLPQFLYPEDRSGQPASAIRNRAFAGWTDSFVRTVRDRGNVKPLMGHEQGNERVEAPLLGNNFNR